MKPILSFTAVVILSVAVAFCLGAAKTPAPAWETAGNASFAPTLLYGFAKIAIGSDGTLWAMVNNKSTSGNLEAYSLPKGSKAWAKVGRGTIDENAYNGAIVVDSSNVPWLSSKGGLYSLQGKKWVPTYAGTYWTDSGKEYAKQYELGNFSALAAGPNGALYVANDGYAGVFERNAELAGKNWDEKVYDASRQVSFFPIGTDKSENGAGYRATPNSAETPCLVWAHDALYLGYDEYMITSHWGFHVSTWNGTAWIDLGDFGSKDSAKGGFSEGAAEYLGMAVSKSGKVFVAYREGSAANSARQWKLSAMMFNGTDDWTDMGKKGFSAHTIETFPICAAFDSKETPYVCFADEEAGTVNVMKYSAGQWQAVGGAVAEGASPSMIMGPDDTLYVAYREKGAESITVKKLKL